MFHWWGIDGVIHEDSVINTLGWSNQVRGKFKTYLWEFNNASFSLPNVIDDIKRRVSDWIVCCHPKFPFATTQVQHNISAVWSWRT